MARRRREFEESTLSMTPLIDVVLLLLQGVSSVLLEVVVLEVLIIMLCMRRRDGHLPYA